MDFFENIKIHFWEMMEEYKWCIKFLMRYWYLLFILNNL